MTVTRSLAELASVVEDGDTVAFGGKTIHRAPMAFVRELVRQGTSDLNVMGLANSMDVDLLCATGQAASACYGYVGFEAFGLAPNYRRACEAGTLDAREGTCYTVATMLRGAKQGVPFVPIAGLDGSDLLDVSGEWFTETTDPFTGESVVAVRTVTPDVGVIHASEADPTGNVRVGGADLTEALVARAADRVLVTTERLVETETFRVRPGETDVPGFLVDGVAEVPRGAHPLACAGEYDYDGDHLEEYLSLSKAGDFETYRERYLTGTEADYRERAVSAREASP
jgi:acyl CoA:acetate/3-ketoacid CoA transferase alpha subunit